MNKRITLPYMNAIRQRIIDKEITFKSPEWKFIKPIFIKGLEEELRITQEYGIEMR